MTCYCTDIGIKKKVNQDSLCIKKAMVNNKIFKMAVVCDGMGGLSKGELASATVVRGFSNWFMTEIVQTDGEILEIKNQWKNLIQRYNERLWKYGKENAVELGTTLTVILVVERKKYLIAQVGDSRAYEIGITVNQITEDQSFVAREIKRGKMTKEQAASDPRRNVLLQCIGASKLVEPVFYEGKVEENTGFLLCSDGFRHKVSEMEMFQVLEKMENATKDEIDKKLRLLVEMNKQRGETDNITVIYLSNCD